MFYPTRSEAVAFRIIEGEAVLLSLEAGVYYTLNEVGRVAWELLDGRNSTDAVVSAICTEYDVEEETARRDVDELLNDLVNEGLIELHDNPGEIQARRESE